MSELDLVFDENLDIDLFLTLPILLVCIRDIDDLSFPYDYVL